MTRRPLIFTPLVLAAALTARTVSAAETPQAIAVEPVWSGHPVGFCLLTKPPFQFVAYYDAQRRMSVAQRSLDSTRWTFTKLPSTLGWDSHNYIALAFDRDGFLHVAGNMHCVPLVYFRSEKPLDAASLRRVPAMVGDREQRVIVQVSDWKGYRWDFGGGGTIVVEVNIGAVRPIGNGRLALDYRYPRGSGTWVLDEQTLKPIPGAGVPKQETTHPIAAPFAKLESKFPGMKKHTRPDSGEPAPGVRFALTWETLEANCDRPRPPPLPEPSLLRVVALPMAK